MEEAKKPEAKQLHPLAALQLIVNDLVTIQGHTNTLKSALNVNIEPINKAVQEAYETVVGLKDWMLKEGGVKLPKPLNRRQRRLLQRKKK